MSKSIAGSKSVLVVGQGAREHALVRALRASPEVGLIHVCPGSDGIGQEARCHEGPPTPERLVQVARLVIADLVVIGPEVPLAAGAADALRQAGFQVFGPSRSMAQLEASKAFAKQFMLDAKVPTAKAIRVTSVAECLDAAAQFSPPFVLKADGLCAGKGVELCNDIESLKESAVSLFEQDRLGEAGRIALLEEFVPGYELSVLVLTNGTEWTTLPLAQDHKRLLDGDQGPNTGGMGTVAPIAIDEVLQKRIEDKVIRPSIAGLARLSQQSPGAVYRGVLFIGLMIAASGPKVLEYNVRFGDPETQVVLPLLDGDWYAVLAAIARGECPNLKWSKRSAACVVLAAKGYPDNPLEPESIGPLHINTPTPHSYVLHAGTRKLGHDWWTNGGRVLNAVAVADRLDKALLRANNLAGQIKWPTALVRRDIGRMALAALEEREGH
jgi:phosphoribosylamine--glycine ligase